MKQDAENGRTVLKGDIDLRNAITIEKAKQENRLVLEKFKKEMNNITNAIPKNATKSDDSYKMLQKLYERLGKEMERIKESGDTESYERIKARYEYAGKLLDSFEDPIYNISWNDDDINKNVISYIKAQQNGVEQKTLDNWLKMNGITGAGRRKFLDLVEKYKNAY